MSLKITIKKMYGSFQKICETTELGKNSRGLRIIIISKRFFVLGK